VTTQNDDEAIHGQDSADRPALEIDRLAGRDELTPAVCLHEEMPLLSEDTICELLEEGQWGDAQMLRRLYGDRVVYDTAENQWYIWGGQRWQRDDSRMLLRLCASQLALQYERRAAATTSSTARKSKEQKKADEKDAERLLQRASALRSARYTAGEVRRGRACAERSVG
jgi:hypothetical protein